MSREHENKKLQYFYRHLLQVAFAVAPALTRKIPYESAEEFKPLMDERAKALTGLRGLGLVMKTLINFRKQNWGK